MVGAGQLARMTHQAAVDLDIELVVLAASDEDSAVVGGAPYRLGSVASLADLEAVASAADVVTFDHELVPTENLVKLRRIGYRLEPTPSALRLAQDKLEARHVLSTAGFPTPAFESISSISDAMAFTSEHGWPIVLKSRRGGYDGRGVHVVDNPGQLASLLKGNPDEEAVWLAEEFVDIKAELSVLIARTTAGRSVVYPAVETFQREGICRYLTMPATQPLRILEQAGQMAGSIAGTIGATGMLAVEMFVTTGNDLLVNELALRPHNSGHATIEACVTSQFHQHLRAVLDWPLGSTSMRSNAAATVNLIGEMHELDIAARLPQALAIPGVHVHLYAKTPRPGRKFGHITVLDDSASGALETAKAAAELITKPR